MLSISYPNSPKHVDTEMDRAMTGKDVGSMTQSS